MEGARAMATKAIPDGYRTATPYLIIQGAADAIEFYKRAFGATELLRMADPQGRVGHAEIKIGDSVIMLADEHPAMGYRGPRSLGGGSILRRPLGHAGRSIRARLDGRYARGRCLSRGDAAACRGCDEVGGERRILSAPSR